MSTSVYPYLPPDELKAREDESTAKELAWLLVSLQETLTELKSGLEDCYALLAPIEPGSTLVLSSPRSESIKGHVTRVGCTLVKGQIHLKLKSHPPTSLILNPTSTTPLPLPALTHLRTLLNQSLDCIDITRWTGDKSSAPFISSQLHLLHSILLEAITTLKGPILLNAVNILPSSAPSSHVHPPPSKLPPNTTSTTTTAQQEPTIPNPEEEPWPTASPAPETFSPLLPPQLALQFTLTSSSLHLTTRVVESMASTHNHFSKFAFATGLQRRLEHDEMDDVVMFRGEEVRVKEKVRVESSVDPGLLSLGAKLGSLERVVEGVRIGLGIVMGVEIEK